MVNKRNSGIELLKIIAIFLIVLFHMSDTLTTYNPFFADHLEAVFPIYPSNNIVIITIALFKGLGILGNLIFFTCSAWFLLEDDKVKVSKVIKMLIMNVFINVLAMSIFLGCGKYLNPWEIVHCCLPTLYNMNWYITLYILFYIFHPLLNKCINALSKPTLFAFTFISFILYGVIGMFNKGFFLGSIIVTFIMVYFVIAYMKKYMSKASNNVKSNAILLIVSIVTYICVTLITNFLGIHYIYFQEHFLFYIQQHNSFFNILIAISLFNLFRQLNFKSQFINYLSSLSLLVYLVHENYIFKMYARPYIFIYIYETFTYMHVIGWLILATILLLISSFIISYIFKLITDKPFNWFSDKIASMLSKIYHKIESKFMKIE